MQAHPGIVFRDGPTGRRAAMASGPDVWEIIREVSLLRADQPEAAGEETLALLSASTGLARRVVQAAISYWAAYPDEIDERIASAVDAEAAALLRWQRERALLGQ